MIVLANEDFAIAFRLCGIKDSYIVKSREDVLRFLPEVKNRRLVIVNKSVLALAPELKELDNLIVIPDKPENFADVSDLENIIKKVVGKELEVF
jgi:vacuolar-type H+-ATPase subunit F/Vma7